MFLIFCGAVILVSSYLGGHSFENFPVFPSWEVEYVMIDMSQQQVLNSLFLGGMVFCQALILALAYYWTALEPSSGKVSFFIATFPVKFLPLVMLAMTFVQAGTGAALVEATGLVAAHLYLFLTDIYPRFGGGRNFLETPNWVHALFAGVGDNASGPRPRAATGPSTRPVAPGTAGATTASGRGIFTPANNQWTHRGQGHRLGS